MNTSVIESKGIAATQYEATLNAADLNWDVKEDKVAGADTGIIMPRKKMIYRSDTNEVLGIVGANYKATCPKEFLQSQYEFAEFIQGKVVRAGFISERSRAFSFIRITEDLKLPRNLRQLGDPTAVYLYSIDGWDGGTPRRSRLYLERLKCTNGMVSKEVKSQLWVSHTKNSEARYSVEWKKFLGEMRVEVETIRNQFITLASTRMSMSEAKTFMGKLFPGEGKAVESRRTQLIELFVAGEGNEGSTRYDALNAVTEYVTHHRTYRETESTSVDTNRFLGVVESDTLRSQAMTMLLAA